MDLNQRKLNKSEWDSIEISVPKSEIDVLNLIIKGFYDVNIRINLNNSIFTFLKIEYSEKIEDYIYNCYLRVKVDKIENVLKKIMPSYKNMKINSHVKPNSADRTRLERFDEKTIQQNDVYEFIILERIHQLLNNYVESNMQQFHYNYYTLYNLIKKNIIHLNRHILELTNYILEQFKEKINKLYIIENAPEFIEQNKDLLKYDDLVLYKHQKEIFTVIKKTTPKLILYMAPTGTGKTMTPIALSENKKIIFVCAARHVGLALARSAISVNKKIAFAFGCASADDIRLHYFAAKEYAKNKRTGGIGKVDNSVGDNVEIMICDIKSYLPAMYYMMAFFKTEDLVTYWDEPTITMDYMNHEFHETIHKNWKENCIPTMVLSSATLPKENEITTTITDFIDKFPGAEICNIISHDCKKSIPIINKDGYVVLPHYLYSDYDNIKNTATHCLEHLSILRYFDLKEVVNFIAYINKNGYITNKTNIDRYFEELNDINMTNIKMYYIHILNNIKKEHWGIIYNYFDTERTPRIYENITVDTKGNQMKKSKSVGPGTTTINNPHSGNSLTRLSSEQFTNQSTKPVGTSGVYVTTKDAYTLTDGPTIFISNQVEKIAKFCVQQANIPNVIMEDLMKKIDYNNVINEKIYAFEREIDALNETTEPIKQNGTTKSKKSSKDNYTDNANKGNINKLTEQINSLRAMIKNASLNETFIPNKKNHIQKWSPNINITNAFSSNVSEQIVADIMALNGIDNLWKVLLMMGIGVFINHDNITYTEIMKKLADEQKLYMIIASSDYIYGTNYQFCHGFLSKDLDLTQEKIIQAMGRIGRNNIQQQYTIRFRDDEQIKKIFTSETDKPEVINMNKLFCSQ